MYKIAKSRVRSQRDVGDVRCVRDENEEVLAKDNEVRNHWRKHLSALMNEGAELAEQKEEAREVEREVELVSGEEMEYALRKTKDGKAVGPDEIPVEVSKIV